MQKSEEERRRFEAFLEWASKAGISDAPVPHPPTPLRHSLSLSHFPDAGGRGLAAVRAIRRGETVLRVPRSALLTRENVLRGHPEFEACFRRHARLSPAQLLAVCLLAEVEKGKDSWWYPYLVLLPRSYTLLANFTHFEIQSFQIEAAIWVSEKAVHEAQCDWKQASSLMKEIKLKTQLVTFKSWLWASATVSSRTLHLPWDSAGCLCPVGDLFNYAAPGDDSKDWLECPPCEFRDEDVNTESLDEFSYRLTDGGYEESSNSYCFYARKRYKKGEQVLLCYGTYTNLELLEHYGFMLDINPNDKYFIPLEMVTQISDSWPKESLYIQQDGKPSFALVSGLRLWATPKHLRRAVGHVVHSGLQLSAANERTVMQFLSKRCQQVLNELPSSAADDDALLLAIGEMLEQSSIVANLSLQSSSSEELREFFRANGWDIEVLSLPAKIRRSMDRWRLAVQWRLMYKKVLLRCISYCNEVVNNLKSVK